MTRRRRLILCVHVGVFASACMDRVTIVRVDGEADHVVQPDHADALVSDSDAQAQLDAMDVVENDERLDATATIDASDGQSDATAEATVDVASQSDVGLEADVANDAPDAPNDAPARVPEPPRLIAPMSTSFLTGATPQLRWELSANTEEAIVEMCADRACTILERSITVTGSTVVWPVALAPGTHFWRAYGKTGAARSFVASATWQFHVPRRAAPVTSAWGTTPDFNGDGFTDVAMGAPDAPTASTTGSVYIYPGGPSSVAAAPSATLRGVGRFGFVAESAGDLNGDGYADLAIGAPLDVAAAGSVTVVYGSSRGIDALAPRTTVVGSVAAEEFGAELSAAGDLNGDGYGDLAVGAPLGASRSGRVSVLYGGPTGLTGGVFVIESSAPVGSGFGTSVSGACDADRDGVADLIIGAPFGSGGIGAAYFVRGGRVPSTPVLIAAPATSEWFAFSVRRAGDVDFDGHCDWVVGSPNDRTNAGSIHVYSSRTSWTGATPTRSIRETATQRGFGYRVSDARDVNGDGIDDIVAGQPETAAESYALVYLGSQSTTLAATPWILGPEGGRFGRSVGGHGDFDGDGLSDIVVGAPEFGAFGGRFTVFGGGASGLSLVRRIGGPDGGYSGGWLSWWLPSRVRSRRLGAG